MESGGSQNQPLYVLQNELNPFHYLIFRLFKINFNIILQSTSRSPEYSLLFRFGDEICERISHLLQAQYFMPCS
jgi:hypothetical protein